MATRAHRRNRAAKHRAALAVLLIVFGTTLNTACSTSPRHGSMLSPGQHALVQCWIIEQPQDSTRAHQRALREY